MSMTFMTSLARHARHGQCASARGFLLGMFALSLATGVDGCSPDRVLGNQSLPPDVPDPAQTATPAGALAAYRGALVQLRTAFGGGANADGASFIPVTGLLTDELRAAGPPQFGGISSAMLVDSRFLPEDPGIGDDGTTALQVKTVYGLLQKVRGQARQARGALLAYAPDSSPALAGHLAAVEGYADVFLADLFCSGVPLSTLDFDGDFTYAAGSSTEQVYAHAVALFDSALAVTADSNRILNLARVGKGRALLALGQYAAAAQVVANVPDDFRYALEYNGATSPDPTHSDGDRSFAYDDFGGGVGGVKLTMVDAEGENGLPFVTSGDPRSAWVFGGTYRDLSLLRPAKYAADGSGAIVLASGIEARLIQGEAALQTNDASWLTTLNALRTDGTYDTQRNAADSTKTDTLWHAGTGGVAGLAPLADPGAPDGRVTLLFQERAYWLFLTGHRQGDLRRLIRQYGRQAERVYPSGVYPAGYNIYGTDVTAPIPGAERVSNPLFTGCRNRGA
jgi:starch-binding outer membrane protein, SusD/RagB family